MTAFWVVLGATAAVGVGTYLTRASFIVSLADQELPSRVRAALQYVAPSVLAALVVSLLVGGEGTTGWVEVTALGAGGAVGWKTRSLPLVLVVGMGLLWLLRWAT